MISIDEDVARSIELIETITLSITTCHHYSSRFTHSPSSNFMLFDVRDVEKSLVAHRQTPAVDIRDDRLSTCATSTRPSHHSSRIADDETICSFVDNHICWKIQLISPVSFSISTSNH